MDYFFDIFEKYMVRKERLELSRLAALEPKSSASTNSATLAGSHEIYFMSLSGHEPQRGVHYISANCRKPLKFEMSM